MLTPLASLHAEEASTFEVSAKVEPAESEHSIKVGEYAAFLRAVAAKESELQSLYNDRLQNYIDRIWVGYHFDYQVREEIEQDSPLRGLLQEEVECYYDWIEHGADSQAAAAATDDKKTEISPLMMWRRGVEEKKSPDEKKSSSKETLSSSDRTDQARRETEHQELFHEGSSDSKIGQQQELEKALQEHLLTISEQPTNHYKKADDLWTQVVQNWAARKEALDKKETEEEKLSRARDLLNQEKIAREAINTEALSTAKCNT